MFCKPAGSRPAAVFGKSPVAVRLQVLSVARLCPSETILPPEIRQFAPLFEKMLALRVSVLWVALTPFPLRAELPTNVLKLVLMLPLFAIAPPSKS